LAEQVRPVVAEHLFEAAIDQPDVSVLVRDQQTVRDLLEQRSGNRFVEAEFVERGRATGSGALELTRADAPLGRVGSRWL
jgi:hypothetical protein